MANLKLYSRPGSSGAWSQVSSTSLDLNRNTITAQGLNGFSQFALGENGPLAVELVRFDAAPAAAGVELSWETACEIDNLGFHLYRSVEQGVLGERLNGALIPSERPGSGQGACYAFLDGTARPGVTYYYTLEDVDANGGRTAHGPVGMTLWRSCLPLVRR